MKISDQPALWANKFEVNINGPVARLSFVDVRASEGSTVERALPEVAMMIDDLAALGDVIAKVLKQRAGKAN